MTRTFGLKLRWKLQDWTWLIFLKEMAYFWKYIYDSNIKGGSIECIDNWYKNNQIKATENLNEVP